jgi:hypothetical protein
MWLRHRHSHRKRPVGVPANSERQPKGNVMLDKQNQASGNNKIGFLLLHANWLTWSPPALASAT